MIDFEGSMDGTPFEGGAGSQYAVELGAGRLVEDLEQGLVGMKVGEERDIAFTMPADYAAEHLAGKPVSFHVKMNDVKERVLPELDDEFATSVERVRHARRAARRHPRARAQPSSRPRPTGDSARRCSMRSAPSSRRRCPTRWCRAACRA